MFSEDNYDLQAMLAKQKAIKDVPTLMTILAEALPELEKSIEDLAEEDRDKARALYANEIRATAFRVHLSVAKYAVRRDYLLRMSTRRDFAENLLRRYGEDIKSIAHIYRYL
jgi:hypothetical protein